MRIRLPHSAIPVILLAAVAACETTTGPSVDRMPEDVAAFVEAALLPEIRSYRELVREDEKDVLLFAVEWGEPRDCPSGCFYFTATGLRHGDRLGWIEVQGAYAAPDAGALVRYDFRSDEEALFSDHLLATIREGEDFLRYLYGVYRLRLVEDPDVPAQVVARLAGRLEAEGWPALAVGMLQRSGPPRCELAVLEELAGLGAGEWSWGPVPDQARQALAECGG